jgi:cytidylate kinase
MPEPAAKPFVIAVDGTAASGKGTIAGMLATHYRLPYLDTGLLYRAVGKMVLDADLPLTDAASAERMAQRLDLSLLQDAVLRDARMGEAASLVAAHPGVRAALLQVQRDFATQPSGSVLDGRDIGTVIAPDAPAKLFIDADVRTRADRRVGQSLALTGLHVPPETILADLVKRDARDSSRADAPLARAPDAILLDTTDMSISTAFDEALRHVEQARRRWEALQRD